MKEEERILTTRPFYLGFDSSYPWGNEFVIELATPTCPFSCSFCAIHIPNVGKAQAALLSTDIFPQVHFSVNYMKRFRTRRVFRINLSIAGSVLDPNSVDPQSLLRSIEYIGENTDIKWLNFETRAELLTDDRYEEICDCAEAFDMQVMPGIGYETRSSYIRNNILHKSLPDRVFEQAVEVVSRRHRTLKPLCLIKPWECSPNEYKQEAYDTIAYLARLQKETGVLMEVHVAPTYVAPETPLHKAFQRGEYTIVSEREFLETLRSFRDLDVRVWVCHHSENRAVRGGDLLQTCAVRDIYCALMQEFNVTNDYSLLDAYVSLFPAIERERSSAATQRQPKFHPGEMPNAD